MSSVSKNMNEAIATLTESIKGLSPPVKLMVDENDRNELLWDVFTGQAEFKEEEFYDDILNEWVNTAIDQLHSDIEKRIHSDSPRPSVQRNRRSIRGGTSRRRQQ